MLTLHDVVDHVIALRSSATREDRGFALAAYRLLAKGEPLRREALAAALDRPTRSIIQTLDSWPALIEYNEDRAIVGFGGLTINPTKHRMLVDAIEVYTWCAWDSLFIPAILGRPVRLTSTSPASHSEIVIHVSMDGDVEKTPDGIVVSFPISSLENLQNDVRGTFCCLVHFFPTPDEGRRWVEGRANVTLVTLDEAVRLGKRKNAIQFGDLLEADSPTTTPR